MKKISVKAKLTLTVLCWLAAVYPLSANARSAPAIFDYAELATLYEQEKLPPPLDDKLNNLLTTPFVDNSFSDANARGFSRSPPLGEFLRVAHWNIERGLEYEAVEAVFGDEARFEAMLDARQFPIGTDERAQVLREAALLRQADVIILNEVDWGMKRSGYRHIVADLAAKTKMNYAFGVQFVELSPVHLSRKVEGATATEKALTELVRVDPARYKGLHGIAILSRLPLENVRLVPFTEKPYDWYQSEKNGASLLEKGRRKLSETVFLEETLREVRRGGRTTLLADLVDPKFPAGRVTVAATHLENRTKSINRVRQLNELLGTVKNIRHPVILAGDMNTSSEDLTPTSFRRELAKRYGSAAFWIRTGIGYALGFGLIEDTLLDGVTFWRKQSDPTVRHIPILMPNAERDFFTTLRNFRFADDGAFDFRGDRNRSHARKSRTLANSNERGGKGFVTTFQVKRPLKLVGKYKLDWILVKPADLKSPTDRTGSYRFAPHFGRTFTEVNEIIENRISDHRPLLVDLPLGEPPIN